MNYNKILHEPIHRILVSMSKPENPDIATRLRCPILYMLSVLCGSPSKSETSFLIKYYFVLSYYLFLKGF